MTLLSTTWILAQEETAEETSNLQLVLPETSELIAGVIAFAIVFFFVWKWALPAIARTLEARQQAIAGRLEEAEKAKREAESLRADYEKDLQQARNRANEIIEEARKQAETVKADIISRAEAEAEQILSKARDDAAAEMQRVMAEARQEVANLSIDLAERVVGESLDRQTQLSLVERYIGELEK